MIGVTMSSPQLGDLAWLAAERFQKHTGLNTVVISTAADRNYYAKLELPSMFNQTVVWFDADLWVIRKMDLSEFDGTETFIGVNDPGVHDPNHFPIHDIKLLELDITRYINTGFFIWNNRREDHRAAFAEARKVLDTLGNRLTNGKLQDFGEQSALNAGIQRYARLRLVSNTYNYMPFAEKHRLQGMKRVAAPLALHAAGYGASLKHDSLAFYEKMFLDPATRQQI